MISKEKYKFLPKLTKQSVFSKRRVDLDNFDTFTNIFFNSFCLHMCFIQRCKNLVQIRTRFILPRRDTM